MRRTAIIGNAGSGKSTLARAIGTRHGIPVLDLDTIFWCRDRIAVPRPHADVVADLTRYLSQNAEWVVEGCYGTLVEATLVHSPRLILLNPGADVCLANCRARPWEPAKYGSKEEQDSYLQTLLAWVAAYYERDGDMSLKGHLALFESYAGPKALPQNMRLLRDDRDPGRIIVERPDKDRLDAFGRIRCPQCGWRPTGDSRWSCVWGEGPEPWFQACGTVWNTFATRGCCPGCSHQWRWTSCLLCEGWSPHEDWYAESGA